MGRVITDVILMHVTDMHPLIANYAYMQISPYDLYVVYRNNTTFISTLCSK